MAAVPQQEEFIGFGEAAQYLGIQRNTLSSYCSERYDPDTGERKPSTGPRIAERRVVKGWALPVFKRDDLDLWKASRPGQGTRTDLIRSVHPVE